MLLQLFCWGRWLRLKEKGGKHHEMPAHHELEEVLYAYITAARIADDKKGPLFSLFNGYR